MVGTANGLTGYVLGMTEDPIRLTSAFARKTDEGKVLLILNGAENGHVHVLMTPPEAHQLVQVIVEATQ